MVAIKLLIFIVILASLMCSDFVEAAAKKQRRNIKHKKSTQNGKLKGNLKTASNSKPNQRNGKMNYYNSHFWPSTSTYYRPVTNSPIFLRSPSTSSSSSMFYPMHWSNSYINPSSFMSSNTLRRTDEFPSSSPVQSQTQPSMMSLPSSSSPMMSMSNSQIPTLYDMSAFTGNSALLEHPFVGNSNQNLWSVGETVATPTSKPKLNLFNSFNYNDDGGLFGGFLNQFLK